MNRPARLLVLALAFSGCAGAAYWAYDWASHEPTIRAAARNFLAERRVTRYADEIRAASIESGVDPYLLAALMQAESSGRLGAVSNKDAMGLFQLSEVTANWRAEVLGLPKPTREQLLSDPLLNARLGANNMAWLLDTFDGNELRALCAYNAGTGRLKKLTAAAGGWEAWRKRGEEQGNSDILAYGQRVLRYRDKFRERGWFNDLIEVEETIDAATGIETGSEAAGTH